MTKERAEEHFAEIGLANIETMDAPLRKSVEFDSKAGRVTVQAPSWWLLVRAAKARYRYLKGREEI